jgi:hypothetical protein
MRSPSAANESMNRMMYALWRRWRRATKREYCFGNAMNGLSVCEKKTYEIYHENLLNRESRLVHFTGIGTVLFFSSSGGFDTQKDERLTTTRTFTNIVQTSWTETPFHTYWGMERFFYLIRQQWRKNTDEKILMKKYWREQRITNILQTSWTERPLHTYRGMKRFFYVWIFRIPRSCRQLHVHKLTCLQT